jgi:hypothetical protein
MLWRAAASKADCGAESLGNVSRETSEKYYRRTTLRPEKLRWLKRMPAMLHVRRDNIGFPRGTPPYFMRPSRLARNR